MGFIRPHPTYRGQGMTGSKEGCLILIGILLAATTGSFCQTLDEPQYDVDDAQALGLIHDLIRQRPVICCKLCPTLVQDCQMQPPNEVLISVLVVDFQVVKPPNILWKWPQQGIPEVLARKRNDLNIELKPP